MYLNYIICISLGIIVYILLYLNKLENLNNSDDENNLKFISNYNLSLKIPLVISLLVFVILNNINKPLNIPNDVINNSTKIMDNLSDKIDLFTDNMSYWF